MNQDRNLYTAFGGRVPDPGRALLRFPPDQTCTYADASRESGRAAAWLQSRGLVPGDRVSVQAPKCPEWLWLYLGCLRAGLVFHPLNDGYRAGELRDLVGDARPRLVVCEPSQRDLFQSITAPGSTSVETLAGANGGSLPGAWAGPVAPFATVPRTPDDPGVLLYSSGTTGRPKGALISHGNLQSNAATLVAAWGFSAADCLLHALPVYHAHGLFVGVGCTLMSGASMAFLPRFEAREVIRWLPSCTVMMGVPTHYTRLLAEPAFDAGTCQSIRLFISGSAPLQPETFAAFEHRTGQRILERYGLTETGMNSANPLRGERRPGSVGPPLPGVDIRIVDAAGERVPAETTGAIELRGPNVFLGYWQQPAETAAAFTPDGWFRTGDQGRFSADGYLSIVGRSKDLIISGGLNVWPREVEIVIDSLPGVVESAVIGVPHPEFGEGVIAVVVAAPMSGPMSGLGPGAGEAAIITATRARLATFKVPKRVFFVRELPRNAMGKVLKNELRRAFADVLSQSVPNQT